MEQALQARIHRFFAAHRDASLLEAVVDTSVDGPCLNLWAWRVHGGQDLDHALRQVAGTGDGGFLADILDERGSSTFEIALAPMYPHWPDGLDAGDRVLAGLLQAAAAGLPAATRVLFHHVDVWPAMELGAGR